MERPISTNTGWVAPLGASDVCHWLGQCDFLQDSMVGRVKRIVPALLPAYLPRIAISVISLIFGSVAQVDPFGTLRRSTRTSPQPRLPCRELLDREKYLE